MLTASKSLHSSSRLPIIVEMINGLRIGANEGGQQPSEMSYPVSRQTPRPHTPPSAKISRKYLAKRAAIAHILTGSGPQTESDVSYRKQRTDDLLTGARTAFRNTAFSRRGGRFFVAPERTISGPRTRRQSVMAASREVVDCVALPQGNIQSLCGTIIFSAIVRPHGISGVV